jgi:hypothetical protein
VSSLSERSQSNAASAHATASPSRLGASTRSSRVIALALAVVLFAPAISPPWSASAAAAVRPSTAVQTPSAAPSGGRAATSLESAAARAGDTGRSVAMSLIGLAFAVAGAVLAFRRDFKEAAGVFAVGIVSVLLATPTGVTLLRDTVASLFGSA